MIRHFISLSLFLFMSLAMVPVVSAQEAADPPTLEQEVGPRSSGEWETFFRNLKVSDGESLRQFYALLPEEYGAATKDQGMVRMETEKALRMFVQVWSDLRFIRQAYGPVYDQVGKARKAGGKEPLLDVVEAMLHIQAGDHGDHIGYFTKFWKPMLADIRARYAPGTLARVMGEAVALRMVLQGPPQTGLHPLAYTEAVIVPVQAEAKATAWRENFLALARRLKEKPFACEGLIELAEDIYPNREALYDFKFGQVAGAEKSLEYKRYAKKRALVREVMSMEFPDQELPGDVRRGVAAFWLWQQAWYERGEGYAADVKPEQMRKFESCLVKAHGLLKEVEHPTAAHRSMQVSVEGPLGGDLAHALSLAFGARGGRLAGCMGNAVYFHSPRWGGDSRNVAKILGQVFYGLESSGRKDLAPELFAFMRNGLSGIRRDDPEFRKNWQGRKDRTARFLRLIREHQDVLHGSDQMADRLWAKVLAVGAVEWCLSAEDHAGVVGLLDADRDHGGKDLDRALLAEMVPKYVDGVLEWSYALSEPVHGDRFKELRGEELFEMSVAELKKEIDELAAMRGKLTRRESDASAKALVESRQTAVAWIEKGRCALPFTSGCWSGPVRGGQGGVEMASAVELDAKIPLAVADPKGSVEFSFDLEIRPGAPDLACGFGFPKNFQWIGSGYTQEDPYHVCAGLLVAGSTLRLSGYTVERTRTKDGRPSFPIHWPVHPEILGYAEPQAFHVTLCLGGGWEAIFIDGHLCALERCDLPEKCVFRLHALRLGSATVPAHGIRNMVVARDAAFHPAWLGMGLPPPEALAYAVDQNRRNPGDAVALEILLRLKQKVPEWSSLTEDQRRQLRCAHPNLKKVMGWAASHVGVAALHPLARPQAGQTWKVVANAGLPDLSQKLVDGDTKVDWKSFQGDVRSMPLPPTVTVDLGHEEILGGVRFACGTKGGGKPACAPVYLFTQTSPDGCHWTGQAFVEAWNPGAGQMVDARFVAPVRARFIRAMLYRGGLLSEIMPLAPGQEPAPGKK